MFRGLELSLVLEERTQERGSPGRRGAGVGGGPGRAGGEPGEKGKGLGPAGQVGVGWREVERGGKQVTAWGGAGKGRGTPGGKMARR